MADRTDYFLKILEKIGVPLMGAILTKGDGQSETTAKHMAALLTKAVETSIALGPLVELEKLGSKEDSVRVALAGLASSVLSDLYFEKGTMPQEADIQKIRDGFQAVITFAENFTASAESALRLDTLEAGGQEVDATQSQIQYVGSFVPVIQVVSSFPFGKPAGQLISDIAQRLNSKAQEIRKNQFGEGGNADDHKRIERALVQSLAALYADCHSVETLRLTGGEDGINVSIDSVWESFDMQAQILEALVHSIVPGGIAVKPASDPAPALTGTKPQTPDTEASPPVEAAGLSSLSSPPMATDDARSESPASHNTPPAAGGANPMGFFSKKPEQAEDESPLPSAAPAEPPPEKTPPPTDSSDDSDESGDSGRSGSGGGNNPMSFFKKGD